MFKVKYTQWGDDMINEEFQKLVLEKLVGLEKRYDALEKNMVTKSDLAEAVQKLPTRDELHQVIAEQQKDVTAMLEIMDKKLTAIMETQIVQGESINILALQQLQTAAEVSALKKAK